MDGSPVPAWRVVFSACCLIVWSLLPTAYCPLPTVQGQPPELPPVGGGDSKPPALPPVGGGGEPKPPPVSINNPGRARLGEPDAGGPSAPASTRGGGDLEFVEKVIEARRAYASSLKAL